MQCKQHTIYRSRVEDSGDQLIEQHPKCPAVDHAGRSRPNRKNGKKLESEPLGSGDESTDG